MKMEQRKTAIKLQQKTPIYDILAENGAWGKENAMKLRDLARIIGKRDRAIIKMVQDERKNTPCEEVREKYICSDTIHGYYLPSCDEDLTHTERGLAKAARTRFSVSNSIRGYLRQKKAAKTSKPLPITHKPTPKRP